LEVSGQIDILVALSLHKKAPGTHLRRGLEGPTATLDIDERRKNFWSKPKTEDQSVC